MKVIRSLLAAALCLAYASVLWAAEGPKKKNWTAPAEKIRAQALADEIMSQHPELISVTFHGVPPGLDKVYTMFAGSFPERIGNPDDPDDVDVITKGITIVDPRWHRANDAVKKFVMMMPLRDSSGENVGLLVLAYKTPSPVAKSETEFFVAATALRDDLKQRIASYPDLFKPAR
ncbi:MAG: hypothetical protein E6J58_18225 [Deltaproteobacteria bacterium]|nr:MAG: hypothetical protein E6J67_13190 [Deltaproteobacteria bacterium]TMB34686.1 MAG: hypothetical protein E6J58_18225 [Deltaproteobacteria bacterium]